MGKAYNVRIVQVGNW